ncbi:MAG: sodium-dependent transporter [Woeseiaceae bacterium]
MSAVDCITANVRGQERPANRGRWSSRLGFVLAASASAVGLGNIWKFPYVTGTNGGGSFVLVYLLCILLVAAPIMIAEILLGRTTQRSPVGAFRAMARHGSRHWSILGWLALVAGFLILSYYFVVAGWTLHYAHLAVTGALFAEAGADDLQQMFAGVYANPAVNVFWQLVFIMLTVAVVLGGVQKGIERCCRFLFPLLVLVLLALLAQAASGPGLARGMEFVFGFRASGVTAAGVLEALGHSFFTLGLGMGAMITYGSYLGREEDVVAATAAVAGLDTFVSLCACMIIFPIIFAFDLAPDAGPGLVFVSLPVAFAQMSGGHIWAVVFFALLAMAALSSTVSVLEVIVSHLCDERRIRRWQACALSGCALFLAGIPSSLSGGTYLFGSWFEGVTSTAFGTGRNWFDFVDYIASNWLLPMSGLGIAVFFAWRVGGPARELAFRSGTGFGRLYWGWVGVLRYLAPPAVIAVFLHAAGMV